LAAVCEAAGPDTIVAEDLGMITTEVRALRDRFELPGMLVLQFAFDGSADNPFLPRNHVENAVAYTGTHDNDTTLGWYRTLDEATRQYVGAVLGNPQPGMPDALIDATLSSPARMAILPMQDLLGLGPAARMNRPGTPEGNWAWRFDWAQVPAGLGARLGRQLAQARRIAADAAGA
jgi:4-alpha-glucanotransferase